MLCGHGHFAERGRAEPRRRAGQNGPAQIRRRPAPAGAGRGPAVKPHRFIIAAGGTGGHLWPALSLARALKKIRPESEFLFVGTGRPIEEKILGPENWNRTVLKTSGIKGQGILGKIKAVGECAAGTADAVKLIRSFKPSLCVGVGGYVTVPVGLAAKICGVPLVIHEQNSRPGLSNKVLARMARLVMVAFEEAAGFFQQAKTVVTGNPIRPEIEALHNKQRDFSQQAPVIVITGGSQGAAALNKAASEAMALLSGQGLTFKIIHQTGEADRDMIEGYYAGRGVDHQVAAFFQDMAAIYGQADLVIGRAGAITISELAAAGLPSVLVPLPTAADDHQTVNARHLSERDAAILLPQKELTPEILAETVSGLLKDRTKLAAMSKAAGQTAQPGADEYMAWIALRVMYGEPVRNIGRDDIKCGN
ncbi:undecaprenyldiphospho-muramoylpentapeptide beta-N-acetylglucosaminyltransferase [Deltaproteobacteria bacterium Smac51]|nr:undecaprenyldiphospho-muramoylpentapeptide beta-N-acetylglucosaminyltransferase [Deltaproteobacteria bacterium Smac51]